MLTYADLMLCQRRRRGHNIKSTYAQRRIVCGITSIRYPGFTMGVHVVYYNKYDSDLFTCMSYDTSTPHM